jgi:hypothetical protein
MKGMWVFGRRNAEVLLKELNIEHRTSNIEC